jgi:membrane-associated phospholipid phosphatase
MPGQSVCWFRRTLTGVVSMGLFFACAEAQAQSRSPSPHRLEWQGEWRRVNGVEYALTTGLFATVVALRYLPALEDALWTRPILIDDFTRRGLRARSRSGRNVAGRMSDAFALLGYLPPLLIDPMIVAGIDDENPDVAWQLFVISTQSYAITVTLNSVSKRVFARRRPYAVSCDKDPEYSDECTDADRFRSFYSGHSAITATSAGLICAHHTHVPLYGGGNIDRLTCAAALAGMFATGTLRIVADKHWHSDVVVGHLLGFAVGYLLPTLVYYKSFQSEPHPQDTATAPLRGTSLPTLLGTSFSF